MKTLQEIFDQVSKHLLKQNKHAVIGTRCTYLAPDGSRCAIGCLIPKRYYDKKMENSVVQQLAHEDRIASSYLRKVVALKKSLIKSGVNPDEPLVFKLLVELQDLHDASPPSNWKNKLKACAKRFKLEFKA